MGLRGAVGAYLSHFDPTYLFTTGDQEWRHHSSDHGQLCCGPALALRRAVVLVRQRWRRPAMQAIGSWLLIGPVARPSPRMPPTPCAPSSCSRPGTSSPAPGSGPLGLAPARGATSGTGCSCWGSASASTSSPSSATTRWSTVAPGRAGPGRLPGVAGGGGRGALQAGGDPAGASELTSTPCSPPPTTPPATSPRAAAWPTPAPRSSPAGPLRFDPYEVRVVNWRTEPRDPEVLFVIEAAANLPRVPGGEGRPRCQRARQAAAHRAASGPMTRLRSSRKADGQVGEAEEGAAVPSVAGQRAISVRRGYR